MLKILLLCITANISNISAFRCQSITWHQVINQSSAARWSVNHLVPGDQLPGDHQSITWRQEVNQSPGTRSDQSDQSSTWCQVISQSPGARWSIAWWSINHLVPADQSITWWQLINQLPGAWWSIAWWSINHLVPGDQSITWRQEINQSPGARWINHLVTADQSITWRQVNQSPGARYAASHLMLGDWLISWRQVIVQSSKSEVKCETHSAVWLSVNTMTSDGHGVVWRRDRSQRRCSLLGPGLLVARHFFSRHVVIPWWVIYQPSTQYHSTHQPRQHWHCLLYHSTQSKLQHSKVWPFKGQSCQLVTLCHPERQSGRMSEIKNVG